MNDTNVTAPDCATWAVIALWTPEANLASGYDRETVLSTHATEAEAAEAQWNARDQIGTIDEERQMWLVGLSVGSVSETGTITTHSSDPDIIWADFTPSDVLEWDDLDGMLGDCGGSNLRMKSTEKGWHVQYDHDRITYEGEAETLKEAMVIARIENSIANTYYAGPFDLQLTPEQLNDIRRQCYLDELGREPEGDYTGHYLKAQP